MILKQPFKLMGSIIVLPANLSEPMMRVILQRIYYKLNTFRFVNSKAIYADDSAENHLVLKMFL